MFCLKCGQELPDDANFCSKCGHLVDKADGVANTVQYAHCIIKWRNSGWNTKWCEAWVGKTVIASFSMKGPSLFAGLEDSVYRELDLAELELVSQLTSQGWEPFPPSQEKIKTLRRVIRP